MNHVFASGTIFQQLAYAKPDSSLLQGLMHLPNGEPGVPPVPRFTPSNCHSGGPDSMDTRIMDYLLTEHDT
ncbi:hypothetical protein BDW69DRAFT_173035 [Aspergillus filifer]